MSRNFALVPAAGTGTRMGDDLPKQYHLLAGRPMIRHALEVLCASPLIQRVFVVLAERDDIWERFDWSELGVKLSVLRCGGPTRAGSVLNGLTAISAVVKPDDWVLVHDAARPCIARAGIDSLIAAALSHPVGGLLAVPVADTLKRGVRVGGALQVECTEARDSLWRALTPQMFRLGPLARALASALGARRQPTDEAQAMEWQGLAPLLVPGDARNIKITTPADLALAEVLLQGRASMRQP